MDSYWSSGGAMASAFRKLDLEKLKQEIAKKFEAARVEVPKPKVSSEEAAEILIRVAAKQLK